MPGTYKYGQLYSDAENEAYKRYHQQRKAVPPTGARQPSGLRSVLQPAVGAGGSGPYPPVPFRSPGITQNYDVPTPPGYKPMSPMVGFLRQNREANNPFGSAPNDSAYGQFDRALAGERSGAYAGAPTKDMFRLQDELGETPFERDPSASAMTNFRQKNVIGRNNFLTKYNTHMQNAMDAGTPGAGLLSDEQAAQMGDYRTMPNVTVGGSYGRGQAGPTDDLLAKRLGETTDPGTLGALRARQVAPWMQPGYGESTVSPLKLGGGNGSNRYTMSPGEPGIDAAALVRQNPNAIYGFTPERQKKLAMDPGYQTGLKARQAAYQQRQLDGPQRTMLPIDQDAPLTADQRVMQNAMARGSARRGRLDARKSGPSFQDILMRDNPEAALAMAAMNQQGQLGLAQILAGQGLRKSEEAVNWAKADPRRIAEERIDKSFDEALAGGMSRDEATELRQQMRQEAGLGGLLNDHQRPSQKSLLSKTEFKEIEGLAQGGDSGATARWLQQQVAAGKMTEEQANIKLNELHPQGLMSWLLSEDPSRSIDDHGGWNNRAAGEFVDPKTGKKWKPGVTPELDRQKRLKGNPATTPNYPGYMGGR